jgi:hypothetical protein
MTPTRWFFELDEAVLAQDHNLSTKSDVFRVLIVLFDINSLVINHFYWSERFGQLLRQWVVTHYGPVKCRYNL